MKKGFTSNIFVLFAFLLIATGTILANEQFQFQVTVSDTNLTFIIPTSGGNGDKIYNWNINWGDDVDSLGITGISNISSAGIKHTYNIAGTYTITIAPGGSTDAWLAAFGFWNNTDGANVGINKMKVTSILSEFTPLMTRTAIQISNNTAPDYEWARTFYGCKKLKTTGPGFSGNWTDITTVGNYFLYSMFQNCSGDDFSMNVVFNLPDDIISVGDFFAVLMFGYCSGDDFTMNDIFNLPDSIKTVGNQFISAMFRGCSGDAFTMNEVFNMHYCSTSAESGFASSMFKDCSGNVFTMNDIFNLPRDITSAWDSFAFSMFEGCSGSAFKMNEVFNLPTDIISVRHNFAYHMFGSCFGDAFTMNNVFNLPAGITSAGQSFVSSMFYNCSGSAFEVNDIFQFQQDAYGQTIVGLPEAYTETFYGITNTQERTLESIIGILPEPNYNKYTFYGATGFSDLDNITINWGGGGNVSISINNGNIPAKFALGNAYPNPFNPTTTINYDLPESQDIKLEVFDITGRLIETLYNGYKEAGHWDVIWDASHQSSGIYIYHLQTGDKHIFRKMLLIK